MTILKKTVAGIAVLATAAILSGCYVAPAYGPGYRVYGPGPGFCYYHPYACR